MTHEQEARELLAERDALKQQVATLTAQRDKAVEALRPVIARATLLEDDHADDIVVPVGFSVRSIRQAAAVLKEIDGK